MKTTHLVSKNSRWLLLFISELGDHLFLGSCALFLMSIGYSPFESVLGSALTVVPNLLLAPILGKLVDRSERRTLFRKLCFGMVSMEILFILLANLGRGYSSLPVWFALMGLALFACPLRVLIEQYLVPGSDVDEQKSFVIWEKIQACAIILSGFIIFGLYSFISSGALIVFDACTFFLMGSVLAKHVPRENQHIPNENSEISKSHKLLKQTQIASFRKVYGPRRLRNLAFLTIFAGGSMVALGDILPASFGLREDLSARQYGLIYSLVAVLDLAGTFAYERAQKHGIISSSAFLPGLAVLVTAVASLGMVFVSRSTVFMVFLFLLVSFLSPSLSIETKRAIRSEIPPGHYGEYFGYVRIPRALLILISVAALSHKWNASSEWATIFIPALFIFLAIISAFFLIKGSKNNHSDLKESQHA